MTSLNILKKLVAFLSLTALVVFAGCSFRPEGAQTLQGDSPGIHEQNGDTTIVDVQAYEASLFFIDLGEGDEPAGDIGCGDSLVEQPLNAKVLAPAGDSLTLIEKTLERFFALEETEYAGHYNALGNSSLTVEDVMRDGDQVAVELRGELILGGVCDNPRVEAQLMSIVTQFDNVQYASIYLNDELLSEVMSLGEGDTDADRMDG